jgi:CelD/BcsL family acetyltransferase involved in cellulose biosynthesis
MNAICNSISSTAFELKTISTIEEFEQLQSPWDSLTNQPLRSFTWSIAWWKNFQHLGTLNILVLQADQQIVAIAPFFVDRWAGQSRLRFIGSGKTCTDYADLIVPDLLRATFTESIAKWAIENGICMLELEGVTGDAQQDEFENQLNERFWLYEKELEPTWQLKLNSNWEDFISGSKKSLRRKIRKAEKRLASEQFDARVTSEDLPIDEAFDVLVELHQNRFEDKGEKGAFSDDHFKAFLFEAFTQLSQRNEAEIVVGYADGQAIAAQLYLMGPNGPLLYQAGVRVEAFNHEPGHLLFTYAARKATENGHQIFDFLRGNEPYKPYWGAEPVSLKTVRFVSKKAAPTAVNFGFRALRHLKSKLRKR